MRGRIAAGLAVAVMILGLNAISCDPPIDAANRAIMGIDQAQEEILAESANWREIVQRMLNDLPVEARNLINADVRNLVDRASAAFTTGILCVVDMVSDKVVEGLEQIKAELLHEDYEAPGPTACQFSPSDISLGLPLASRQKIEVSGYDFDSDEPLVVKHVLYSGDPVDVSNIYTKQTRYKATLAIDQVPFGPNSKSLKIYGLNALVAEIQVFQPVARPCKTDREDVAPEDKRVPINHTAGDNDFYGHGPLMYIGFSLRNEGNALKAVLAADAYENVWDPFTQRYITLDTTGSGRTEWLIYEVKKPGWHITSYTPSGWLDGETYRDTSTLPDLGVVSSGNTLVKSWDIVGDIWGADMGVTDGTSVVAHFSKLHVEVAENPGNEGCVA
jgi:hypothetical protein